EDYAGSVVDIHKWSGLATAAFAIAATSLHVRLVKSQAWHRLTAYRATLGVTVLFVSVAGHFGASLTHVSDFLTSTLPWNDGAVPAGVHFDVDRFAGGELSETQVANLNLEVRSIFAHN